MILDAFMAGAEDFLVKPLSEYVLQLLKEQKYREGNFKKT